MPDTSLECYLRREGRDAVLVLEGTLDVATSDLAERHFNSYLEKHGAMLKVDMSRLDFIDSRGLGVLINAFRKAREQGGYLHVQAAAHPVKRLLQTCGLASFFTAPVEPDSASPEPEAVAAAVKAGSAAARRKKSD